MDSGECTSQGGSHGKRQLWGCHRSLHIKNVQQLVESSAGGDTVISLNDFKHRGLTGNGSLQYLPAVKR